MRRVWHEQARDGGILIAHRLAPDRWDVAVDRAWQLCPIGTVRGDRPPGQFDITPRPLSPGAARRMARAIRQDLWRACKSVRAFTPRVHVILAEGLATITAGATVQAAIPPDLSARVAALLDDPKKRALWHVYAGVKEGDPCSQKS